MIPLLIGLFFVILFIVAIVFSVATWRAWHIVALCFTFLASIGFLIVGSMSVKTRTTWRKLHAEVESKLDVATRDGRVLEWGDPAMVESPDPSAFDLQQRLSRDILDRGRVWRQCTPGIPAGDTITVSTVPPLPTGEPGDAATARPNGIQPNMVLYAFREGENQRPIAYLGEFQVVEAQPAAITLRPTSMLDGVQQRLVADRSAPWTLYEMMPIDAHRVFANEDTVGRSLDDTATPIFGQMNEEELRTMFAAVTSLAPDSEIVSLMVAPYVRNGSPATEQEVNLYPENIWQKLEFEKAHTERVNSANPDPGLGGSFFDQEGLAQSSHLRSGEDASFRAKDIGVFSYTRDEDKQFVDSLITNGVCRSLGPYYVRSLRDYKFAFQDLQARLLQRQLEMARAQRDIEALNNTIRQTQQQIAYRQEERTKLRADLEGYQRDGQGIRQLVAALESQRTTLQQELSELYRTNLALSQQLAEFNTKVTEEINRRAADVAMQGR